MKHLKTLFFLLILFVGFIANANPQKSEIQTNSNSNFSSDTIAFSKKEIGFLKSKKMITMCVDPDWMPMERIHNGKHEGIAADFIKIFEGRLGYPIVLVPVKNWDESLEFAKSRQCDILSLAMSTPNRLKYMNFTTPYLRLPMVVATQKDAPFIYDIANLTDKKLGIVSGYAFGEIFRNKYPEMNLVDVSNLQSGLEMVHRGELFGMIDTIATIGYSLQQSFPELKIAGKFDETWDLGVAVRNDEPLLLSIFEKIINVLSIRESQSIINQWISVRYDKGVDYSLIWKILAVAAFLFLMLLYHHLMLKKYNKQLEALTVTDKLTGLFNRLKLDNSINEHLDNFQRYKRKFSILMLDLDFFKAVNDEHGHQTGDATLLKVASILKGELRKTDIIGRWGGEEFLIIVPESMHELDGYEVAEKIRKSFLESDELQRYGVTASIGVAEVTEEDTFNSIIKRADNALYKAKNNGRNRVEQA